MLLLFKKKFCASKLYIFLMAPIILSTFSLSAQTADDSFSTKSGTTIRFQDFDKKYYETLQYLKFADRLISSYLNSSAVKKTYICRIYVLSEKVKNDINIVESSENINIYLNKDFRTAKNKYYIISKMINAMLLGKTGFNPNTCKFPLPAWLTVGIYGKLELRFSSHSILPVTYFPGLKALCQAGKLPGFKTSINTALYPEADGTAFELYQELCRFLLSEIKLLSTRANNPLTDLIFLTARGKYSPDQIFDYTVGRSIIEEYDRNQRLTGKKYAPDSLSDDKKIQTWFEQAAERRLINLSSPLPTRLFEERFERFRKFTCINKEKGKAPETMTRDISRVDEIYDRFGMSLDFSKMLDAKCRELDALLNVAQPLCSEYLEKLRTDLQQFDELPALIIKRRLNATLPQLKAAFERQRQIEDYLRKLEYSTVAPGKLYRNELLEDKRLRNNFCPEINNYLDQVEKSFLKD